LGERLPYKQEVAGSSPAPPIGTRRTAPPSRDTSRAMSQAEIETLRALYAAISRGDWDTVLDNYGPDFEFITPDQNPIAGTYRGAEAVRGFFDELWAAFDEVTLEPGLFLEADDGFVVSLHMTLSPSNSSAKVEQRITHLWTMRNGKPVRCKVFLSREEALEAAGLSERDAHADS
jgi:uncharacterized protein